MLPLALLAGGRATRMYPLTEKTPKSLLSVHGEAFIVHQLRYLRAQGLQKIVICIGHLGEHIESMIGDGSAFDLSIAYSYDGPSLLGTGGALKKAIPLLGGSFFVLYGDSFLPISFSAVEHAYVSSGKPALMTILKNNNQWDSSNILFSKGQIRDYNKRISSAEMMYIDYGLSIASADIFIPVPENFPCDLADLYHVLAQQGHLAGYEVTERFYEIGSPKGFEETKEYFNQRR